MDYLPTSELEAINVMLAGIGEMPVDSVEDSGYSEALEAQTTLRQVMKSVQSTGLDCNSEVKFKFLPDADGFINLPANTLDADPSDPFLNYCVRGTRLYDRDNHTFVFTEPVEVDLILYLPLEDLPEPVISYIMIKASRIFQKNKLGSDTIHALTKEDEDQARILMRRSEEQKEDNNFLYSRPIGSNAIRRRSIFGRI